MSRLWTPERSVARVAPIVVPRRLPLDLPWEPPWWERIPPGWKSPQNAIVRVQGSGQGSSAASTTVVVSASSTPAWVSSTAGNLLAIAVIGRSSSTPAISSVKDSGGNTWSSAISHVQGGSAIAAIYYFPNNPGGITSITVTFTGSLDAAAWAWEFSGVATSSPLDGSGAITGGSSASPNSGNYTTLNANDVLLALIEWNGTSSISGLTSGFTNETQQSATAGTLKCQLQPAYQIVSATGTYSYGGTITSAIWNAGIIGFEASGAGPVLTAKKEPMDIIRAW